MNYVDRSEILQGLIKFPGADLNGCLRLYNQFYDTYLDRARLIYGDTTVDDVTPDSVTSTLKSRYMGSVMSLYQGRDHFVENPEAVIDLGVNSGISRMYATVAPLGPKDLCCVIFGVAGDGINTSLDTVSVHLTVYGVTILRDAVWGNTFLGSGTGTNSQFVCNTYRSYVTRVPEFPSGVNSSTSFSASVEKDLINRNIQVRIRLRVRDGQGSMDFRVRQFYDQDPLVEGFNPSSVFSSGRFTFYQFTNNYMGWSRGSGGQAVATPDEYRLAIGRFAVASNFQEYSANGAYSIVPAGNAYFCTYKDYYSLVSAAMLNAAMR